MASDNVQFDEQAEIERLIASVPMIPEVEGTSVRLDEDWSGDPAVYISFHVKPTVSVDEVFLKRFLAYTNFIQATILHSRVARFPYAKLEQAA